MKELYWIERLDSIQTFLMVLLLVSVLCLVLALLLLSGYPKESKDHNLRNKVCKISGTSLVLSAIVLVFVPSTKEMYRIVGVGGTIDYLRQNETAKQLPDKCIKALDLFVNKMVGEESEQDSLDEK